MTRKKLLFVGDAACPSGFARATHAYVDALDYRADGGGDYDVTVLGLNYRGDPHSYPYPIYAASAEGDSFGVGRLIWMCDFVKPDVIVIQNDPWNFPHYLRRLAQFPEYRNVPVVGVVAVDGKNCGGHFLSGLSLAVFWTKFALIEARRGGYTGPAVVVPLGVDTSVFHPVDRYEARQSIGLPKKCDDAFIVGNVNRNQPRKRLDLTLKYFSRWLLSGERKDAYLYLHVAPTGDTGVHIDSLAAYYGITDRVVVVEPPVWYGIGEQQMVMTYNCFDVQVSTSQGEGFGLTTFEGMACGVPQIVPDWAALGELCRGVAQLVQCPTTAIGMPYTVNVIGGVADEDAFVAALDLVYGSKSMRFKMMNDGLVLTAQPKFDWGHIGNSVRLAIDVMMRGIVENIAGLESSKRVERQEMERVAAGMGA